MHEKEIKQREKGESSVGELDELFRNYLEELARQQLPLKQDQRAITKWLCDTQDSVSAQPTIAVLQPLQFSSRLMSALMDMGWNGVEFERVVGADCTQNDRGDAESNNDDTWEGASDDVKLEDGDEFDNNDSSSTVSFSSSSSTPAPLALDSARTSTATVVIASNTPRDTTLATPVASTSAPTPISTSSAVIISSRSLLDKLFTHHDEYDSNRPEKNRIVIDKEASGQQTPPTYLFMAPTNVTPEHIGTSSIGPSETKRDSLSPTLCTSASTALLDPLLRVYLGLVAKSGKPAQEQHDKIAFWLSSTLGRSSSFVQGEQGAFSVGFAQCLDALGWNGHTFEGDRLVTAQWMLEQLPDDEESAIMLVQGMPDAATRIALENYDIEEQALHWAILESKKTTPDHQFPSSKATKKKSFHTTRCAWPDHKSAFDVVDAHTRDSDDDGGDADDNGDNDDDDDDDDDNNGDSNPDDRANKTRKRIAAPMTNHSSRLLAEQLDKREYSRQITLIQSYTQGKTKSNFFLFPAWR